MILTRIIFLFFISLLFLPFLTQIKYSYEIRIFEKFLLLIIFGVGVILIIKPAILDILSKYLKTDRRQDILIYSYIIISLWGLIRTHIRVNKLSSKINQLISETALLNAKIEDNINLKKS